MLISGVVKVSIDMRPNKPDGTCAFKFQGLNILHLVLILSAMALLMAFTRNRR